MRICIILFTALLVGACSAQLTPSPPSMETPGRSTESVDTEAIRMIEIAIADLATRLTLDVSQVNVLSIEPHIWPNTSLGCPRPGKGYAEQTVPGYLLILESNGQEYVYHMDTVSTVILCTEEDLPSFPVTPGEIDDGVPWMPVD